MKIGVFGLNSGAVCDAAATARLAPLAEELGYDSWWVGEHVVLPSPQVPPSPAPPELPMLDPFVHLALVAGLTTRIALATGIVILPQRNPVVLAKQVASLDVVSNGRFWFGVGVGYLEPEFRAVGVPFDDRGPRTDEYLDAMHTLWTAPAPISFHGERVQFEGIDANPRPLQPGGPPIVVGGHTRRAFRRAVARGHHWYGFARTPEQVAADLAGLRRAADEVERPEQLGHLQIDVTPRGRLDAALVEAYHDAGVDRIVAMPSAPTVATAEERMAHDAALVMP